MDKENVVYTTVECKSSLKDGNPAISEGARSLRTDIMLSDISQSQRTNTSDKYSLHRRCLIWLNPGD